MNRLRLLPFMLIALACLLACSDDEPISAADTDYRYDIVTYQGQNDTGALFECVGRDDSGSVVLQSAVNLSGEANVNQRVMLRYDYTDAANPPQAKSIRNINVYGCYAIISDTVRRSANALADYPMHQVKLRSMWRTGNYINLHAQVEYTDAARTFMLLADSATLDDDTVHCYLVHDLRGQQGTFWRDCYASFYVGALWHKTSCHTLRIHLNDVTYPDVTYYDFNKQH